ncbi:high affinity immunoglobulin epsilon receptor subunit gamma isoform X2 [Heteronotia binoei]|uniref:high affinity immunoglobulin epsilon receptor subunit gamma isoform X2 n=1 Tax=Heteronotia binoei TaxID=13085 RepID=UPI0029301C37|nr:high affinity immunoglobulin epsilon receptor subunit gamma isoform X2 [Heteronotia binoei]
MKLGLLTALLVLLTAAEAEALQEPQLCYILDGILFVYGITLTFLYCRLKIRYRKKAREERSAIYEVHSGLVTQETDTYTPLELPKVEARGKVPEEPVEE